MQNLFRYLGFCMVAMVAMLGLTACGDKTDPTVTPTFNTQTTYYVEDNQMPSLSIASTDTPGEIAWIPGQTIQVGTHDYRWGYVPTDTEKFKAKAGTLSVTFVAKQNATINTLPTASAITYGQTLANSTLTNGVASCAGTFVWETTSTAPTVSDSNVTEYNVIFTPSTTDANAKGYKVTICKVKVLVNPQSVSEPSVKGSYTYCPCGPATAEYNGFNSSLMKVESGATQENAGQNFTIVISLKDKVNYVWATSGTNANINLTWSVAKNQLLAPTVTISDVGTASWQLPEELSSPDKVKYVYKINNGTEQETITTQVAGLNHNDRIVVKTVAVDIANLINSGYGVEKTYTAPTFGVKYYTKDGSLSGTYEDGGYYTAEYTFTIGLPTLPNPVKTGFDFRGWYTEANADNAAATVGTKLTSIARDATGDKSLYAYFVTHVANTPIIETDPTASAIEYGQTLADSTLTGGEAKFGEVAVAGTFSWQTGTTKPTVADSNVTEYNVVFTPTDGYLYNTVTTVVKLEVNKARVTIAKVSPQPAITKAFDDSTSALTLLVKNTHYSIACSTVAIPEIILQSAVYDSRFVDSATLIIATFGLSDTNNFTFNGSSTLNFDATITPAQITFAKGTKTDRITKVFDDATQVSLDAGEDEYYYYSCAGFTTAQLRDDILNIEANFNSKNVNSANKVTVEAVLYDTTNFAFVNSVNTLEFTDAVITPALIELAVKTGYAQFTKQYNGNDTARELVFDTDYTISCTILNADAYVNVVSAVYNSPNVADANKVTATFEIINNENGNFAFKDSINTIEFSNATITKALLTKPTVVGTYEFTGEEQTVELSNFSTETMTITNNIKSAVDTYQMTITLKTPANYAWVGEEAEVVSINLSWTIAPANILVTASDISQEAVYLYSGETAEFTTTDFTISNANVSITAVALDNTESMTEVGNKAVVITITANANYLVNGKASDTIQFTATLSSPTEITAPTLSATEFFWTGEPQVPTCASTADYTINGLTQQTDVGTYTCTAQLKEGKLWATTGDRTDITLTWSIIGVNATLNLRTSDSSTILLRDNLELFDGENLEITHTDLTTAGLSVYVDTSSTPATSDLTIGDTTTTLRFVTTAGTSQTYHIIKTVADRPFIKSLKINGTVSEILQADDGRYYFKYNLTDNAGSVVFTDVEFDPLFASAGNLTIYGIETSTYDYSYPSLISSIYLGCTGYSELMPGLQIAVILIANPDLQSLMVTSVKDGTTMERNLVEPEVRCDFSENTDGIITDIAATFKPESRYGIKVFKDSETTPTDFTTYNITNNLSIELTFDGEVITNGSSFDVYYASSFNQLGGNSIFAARENGMEYFFLWDFETLPSGGDYHQTGYSYFDYFDNTSISNMGLEVIDLVLDVPQFYKVTKKTIIDGKSYTFENNLIFFLHEPANDFYMIPLKIRNQHSTTITGALNYLAIPNTYALHDIQLNVEQSTDRTISILNIDTVNSIIKIEVVSNPGTPEARTTYSYIYVELFNVIDDNTALNLGFRADDSSSPDDISPLTLDGTSYTFAENGGGSLFITLGNKYATFEAQYDGGESLSIQPPYFSGPGSFDLNWSQEGYSFDIANMEETQSAIIITVTATNGTETAYTINIPPYVEPTRNIFTFTCNGVNYHWTNKDLNSTNPLMTAEYLILLDGEGNPVLDDGGNERSYNAYTCYSSLDVTSLTEVSFSNVDFERNFGAMQLWNGTEWYEPDSTFMDNSTWTLQLQTNGEGVKYAEIRLGHYPDSTNFILNTVVYIYFTPDKIINKYMSQNMTNQYNLTVDADGTYSLIQQGETTEIDSGTWEWDAVNQNYAFTSLNTTSQNIVFNINIKKLTLTWTTLGAVNFEIWRDSIVGYYNTGTEQNISLMFNVDGTLAYKDAENTVLNGTWEFDSENSNYDITIGEGTTLIAYTGGLDTNAGTLTLTPSEGDSIIYNVVPLAFLGDWQCTIPAGAMGGNPEINIDLTITKNAKVIMQTEDEGTAFLNTTQYASYDLETNVWSLFVDEGWFNITYYPANSTIDSILTVLGFSVDTPNPDLIVVAVPEAGMYIPFSRVTS